MQAETWIGYGLEYDEPPLPRAHAFGGWAIKP